MEYGGGWYLILIRRLFLRIEDGKEEEEGKGKWERRWWVVVWSCMRTISWYRMRSMRNFEDWSCICIPLFSAIPEIKVMLHVRKTSKRQRA